MNTRDSTNFDIKSFSKLSFFVFLLFLFFSSYFSTINPFSNTSRLIDDSSALLSHFKFSYFVLILAFLLRPKDSLHVVAMPLANNPEGAINSELIFKIIVNGAYNAIFLPSLLLLILINIYFLSVPVGILAVLMIPFYVFFVVTILVLTTRFLLHIKTYSKDFYALFYSSKILFWFYIFGLVSILFFLLIAYLKK